MTDFLENEIEALFIENGELSEMFNELLVSEIEDSITEELESLFPDISDYDFDHFEDSF